MNNKTLILIVLAIGGYFAGKSVHDKYQNAEAAARAAFIELGEFKDSSQKTIEEMQGLISDLRGKLAKQDADYAMQLEELEQLKTAAKQAEDIAETRPIGPLIVMHTSAGCLPCEQWKRDQMPAWKAKGWEVKILPPETTSDKGWPWFEVYEGGKRTEVVGPLTLDSYMRAKR